MLQVPQLAALFYSNCQHIAQQLLLLPHCYPVLQQLAGKADSLADDALRLRAAGQACLESLVWPLLWRLASVSRWDCCRGRSAV